jgi:hypothetical protein
MAERTHNKPRYSDIPNNDDRPSQRLSFSFLYDKSISEDVEPFQVKEKNDIHLESNDIKFFHSQKSVWFRQLLK